MSTLPRTKHSQSHKVRAAHHKVLDDLDDAKDLSFALIQDACVANFAATLTIANRLPTLTSATLLQGVATILELQSVTPAPSAVVAQQTAHPARSYAD